MTHKKQHYVPQTYLKAFGREDKPHGRIWRMDVQILKVTDEAIGSTMQDRFFYDSEVDEALKHLYPTQGTENFLSKHVENRLGKLLEKLNVAVSSHPRFEMPDQIKMELCHLMAVQLLRTKFFREAMDFGEGEQDKSKVVQVLALLGGPYVPELAEYFYCLPISLMVNKRVGNDLRENLFFRQNLSSHT